MRTLILAATFLLAACAGTAAPPASLSPSAVSDALESQDAAARAAALDAVRANPGAYTPPTFAWVARELFARGETEEAIYWSEFGGQRLSVDLALAAELYPDRDQTLLQMLPGRYADDAGDDLLTHYRALPPAALIANYERVRAADTATPRLYTADWALNPPNFGYETDWAANPARRTAAEEAALARVTEASTPTFRRTIDLLIMMQNAE